MEHGLVTKWSKGKVTSHHFVCILHLLEQKLKLTLQNIVVKDYKKLTLFLVH